MSSYLAHADKMKCLSERKPWGNPIKEIMSQKCYICFKFQDSTCFDFDNNYTTIQTKENVGIKTILYSQIAVINISIRFMPGVSNSKTYNNENRKIKFGRIDSRAHSYKAFRRLFRRSAPLT